MDKSVSRWDQSPAVEERVEQLMAELALADKIELVSGRLAVADDGTEPPRPPGVPRLALADSPAGIRLANPTLPDHRATALPAPIALAATWDPELARRYGHVLGAEAAATGHNIFLGPAIDIAPRRVPGAPLSRLARTRCCRAGWQCPRSRRSRPRACSPVLSTM